MPCIPCPVLIPTEAGPTHYLNFPAPEHTQDFSVCEKQNKHFLFSYLLLQLWPSLGAVPTVLVVAKFLEDPVYLTFLHCLTSHSFSKSLQTNSSPHRSPKLVLDKVISVPHSCYIRKATSHPMPCLLLSPTPGKVPS